MLCLELALDLIKLAVEGRPYGPPLLHQNGCCLGVHLADLVLKLVIHLVDEFDLLLVDVLVLRLVTLVSLDLLLLLRGRRVYTHQ